MYGNISELGDVGSEPGKSYLFFLTAFDPGIRLTGERVTRLGKHFMSEVSGASLTTLENPREILSIFAPLVVPITASGLQGEQPLVDRTM